MIQKLLRITTILALIALVGGLGRADVLRADDDQDGKRPPQTLPSGFESTDRLLRDVERAERAPLYSAWIVESSRFMNVPFGGFQPDKAGLNTTVNLPVNVGIIEGPDRNLTLYDSGWSSDGHVWATLQNANKLLRISPGGETKAFEVPTRASGLGDVAVSADGVVWFLEIAANKVGRFAEGRFEEFAVPTPSAGLTGLAVAPDGAAWFTELRGHRLGRLHAGGITEFVLPRSDARPFGITVDAGNNVWYTDLSGWLGRLDADRARAR